MHSIFRDGHRLLVINAYPLFSHTAYLWPQLCVYGGRKHMRFVAGCIGPGDGHFTGCQAIRLFLPPLYVHSKS